MDDNKSIKLTVQEALSNENVGRNIATLPWRVIDRLNLRSGDVIEIEDLKKTYAVACPGITGAIHNVISKPCRKPFQV